MAPIRITVLGSGTSVGVPTIGCTCEVCGSDDPRDKRRRPSILVSFESDGREQNVVIDTTPDFRQQALDAGFKRLDAILYTHPHADHIMGLDDIRPYNYGRRDRIPVYADGETMDALKRVFPYGFAELDTHPGGVPRVTANLIDGQPIRVADLDFRPFPVRHGPKTIQAFRFGNAAYITDQSDIPDESLPFVEGLDVLFLDALRHEPHPMHSTVERSLRWVEKLKPKRAFFTHICHDLPHEATNAQLPAGVELAYDGLVIEVSS